MKEKDVMKPKRQCYHWCKWQENTNYNWINLGLQTKRENIFHTVHLKAHSVALLWV